MLLETYNWFFGFCSNRGSWFLHQWFFAPLWQCTLFWYWSLQQYWKKVAWQNYEPISGNGYEIDASRTNFVDFLLLILYLVFCTCLQSEFSKRWWILGELQLVDGTGFDSDSYPVLILELVPKVRPGSFWFSLTGTRADSFNPPNQVLTQHWFKSQFGFHKLTPWKLLDLQIPNCQCEICGIWFVCWCTQPPNGAGDYYDFYFYSGWWQKIATLESKLQLAHEELVKSQTTLFIARSEKT
jgi:hypothetical protein